MRLIDADRLKDVFKRNPGYEYADIIDMQPTLSINPQESIFDKIKAELDAQINLHDTPFEIDDGIDASYCDGLNKAKQIIDKYTSESEDKE